MYIEDTCCCGVGEFDGLEQRPEQCLIDLGNHIFACGENRRGMYIFTDRVKNGNGVALAKFIKANKEVGSVQVSKGRVNPNTGHMVKLWIYYPNWTGLKKFYQANRNK
jgi:hypothetical protein